MDWVEAMEVWQAAHRFSARTLHHLRDLVARRRGRSGFYGKPARNIDGILGRGSL
jgi:hypothetical protein